jgi:cardiolipin synthase
MASKVNTTLQIVLVVVVVASLGLRSVLSVPAWLVDGLIYGVLATTVWSGVDYVWAWGLQAYRARSRPQHK